MSSKTHSIDWTIARETEIIPVFHSCMSRLEKKTQKNFTTGPFYHDLLAAFTEGVSNTIRHAMELEKKGKIKGQLEATPKAIRIEILDHGRGFDPEEIPPPRFKKLSESGRGLFMMRQLVDSLEYKRSKKKNALILKRFLPGADAQNIPLDLLYEMSDAFSETLSIEGIYNLILGAALKTFGVERASILILDKETKRLKVAASRGIDSKVAGEIDIKPGEGIAGHVFYHAKPCLIQDIRKNKSGWSEKKQYKSRSFISAPMICSPMRLGQESIGVINLTDRSDGRPFTRSDLTLLTTMANQASAYLYIVRLLSQAREAEAVQRELAIAQEIQRSYLPRHSPQIAGLDLAGWCQQAQSVGGDYFDFIQKDPSNFYVVIADVSGHNVAAALTMANFRSHLRAILLAEEDPGKILTLLNKNLYEDLAKSDQFISMVLLRFKGNEVSLANAGHRFPLVIRSPTKKIEPMEGGQTVLGVALGESYQTFCLNLEKGDAVFLYTDGLTELSDRKGSRFGQEKLVEWLKTNGHLGANRLMSNLKKKIEELTAGSGLSDDATVVAIKRI